MCSWYHWKGNTLRFISKVSGALLQRYRGQNEGFTFRPTFAPIKELRPIISGTCCENIGIMRPQTQVLPSYSKKMEAKDQGLIFLHIFFNRYVHAFFFWKLQKDIWLPKLYNLQAYNLRTPLPRNKILVSTESQDFEDSCLDLDWMSVILEQNDRSINTVNIIFFLFHLWDIDKKKGKKCIDKLSLQKYQKIQIQIFNKETIIQKQTTVLHCNIQTVQSLKCTKKPCPKQNDSIIHCTASCAVNFPLLGKLLAFLLTFYLSYQLLCCNTYNIYICICNTIIFSALSHLAVSLNLALLA